ncbi:MAG: choline kinase, partial [Crocinitomicaceae bacterium]|nr:choline kinase [Crocinitomicaceae bacterium]
MELVLEQFIIEATGAASISNTELIQEVWSGFGQVLRVTLQGAMA